MGPVPPVVLHTLLAASQNMPLVAVHIAVPHAQLVPVLATDPFVTAHGGAKHLCWDASQ